MMIRRKIHPLDSSKSWSDPWCYSLSGSEDYAYSVSWSNWCQWSKNWSLGWFLGRLWRVRS